LALAADAVDAVAGVDVPLLELRGVRAAYGQVEVLHGVDLVVPGGALVAVLGPNGAGKTTTLRVVSGLLAPTGGAVLLEGYDVAGASPVKLAQAGVCLIPEGRGIFPNLTVRENVLMDTYGSRRSVADLEAITYERFPRLGERRDQVAGTLSGGVREAVDAGGAGSRVHDP
jgi:branched-chain amino acid transport system ATP-binding protein